MSVPLVTTVEELRSEVSKLYLHNDGDGIEQGYWPAINDGFPNYERFWRMLVVPTTRRIERVRPEDRIKRREGIAEDLWLITYVNYSLFLALRRNL